MLWSFAGDAKLKVRSDIGEFIRSVTTVALPPMTENIIDYEVRTCVIFYAVNLITLGFLCFTKNLCFVHLSKVDNNF